MHRTENGIKNHWNCSVKKKLDPYSGRRFALNYPGFATSVLHNNKAEEGSEKSMEVKERLHMAISLDHEMDSERDVSLCLDLVLGNAVGRKSCVKPYEKKNHRVTREEANRDTKPPSVTCGVIGERCQTETIKTKKPGDSDNIIAEQPNDSCHNLSADHINSSCSRLQIHKPSNRTNPSASRPLAGYLPQPLSPVAMEVNENDANFRILHHNQALPVTHRRSLEDPKSTHADAFSRDCLGGADSSFSRQLTRPGLFRTSYVGSDRGNDTGLQPKVGETDFGCLCYEPLQEEDLRIFMSTGRFSSSDRYVRVPTSPVYPQVPTTDEKVKSVVYSTPDTTPRSAMSFNYSSPESTLRSAAMTFTNMPSIIRKRRLRISKQLSNANHSVGVYTLTNITDTSSNDKLQSVRKCPSVEDDLLPNAMQVFLSPPKSQKLEDSAAIKSVEKRLENAFDNVFNARQC
ncbi:unnamed protein product [Ilex paraguariensis]|uniref:Uncharacterized protein n=1 Tax=Ilex paraguariensis TaxID=185542 RepID=A0ABC8QP23_9AQUA